MLKMCLIMPNVLMGLWNLHMYIFPEDGTPFLGNLIAVGCSVVVSLYIATANIGGR